MLKRSLLVFFVLLILLAAVMLLKTFLTRPPLQMGQPYPIKELPLNENMIHHLQECISIRTISGEYTKDADSSAWLDMQSFLLSRYPEISRRLTRIIIGHYNIVYRWQGSDSKLPPIVLAAHMDVAPADTGKTSLWLTNPFKGTIRGNYIYGRGSLDDKISVIGIMEAAEYLVASGFTPRRTIYFAFGPNEETGGAGGAQAIAAWLKSQNVKADYVLDEGLAVTQGIIKEINAPVALIGISEKGFASLNLQVQIPGGHSSYPEKDNAISVLAHAIVALNAHPLPTRFTPPVTLMFNQLAPHMPFMQRLALENRWLFSPILLRQMSHSHTLNAAIRTTGVPTIINAGLKDNIVPGDASAVVNFRILPGDSIAGVIEWARKWIDDKRVHITLLPFASEPSPVSDVHSEGFRQLSRVVKGTFPKSIVAPSLVIGATDSRYYRNITGNIFRFSPFVVNNTDLERIHGTNERISFTNFQHVITFFYNLLLSNG